jgi:PAS domain S-box-containing protein
VLDVTEQMETAAALADSEFRFDTLTDTLPQIIWSGTADGVLDYVSRRWFEFIGIAEDEVEGRPTWVELLHPEDRERVAACWKESLATGKTYDVDYRMLHRSGEYRWLRVMARQQWPSQTLVRDRHGHS